MIKSTKIINIFYCYAPEDKSFLDEIEKRLAPKKRLGQIKTWDEGEVYPGSNKQQEIEKHLRSADIVLLLVSPDFFASQLCQTIQQKAVELHNANKITYIIPIILRPTNWKQGTIENFAPLPKNEKPISTWKNQDEAFLHIEKEITNVINNFLDQPQQQSDIKEGIAFIGYSAVSGYNWDNNLCPAPGLAKQENASGGPWLISSQPAGLEEISERYSIIREKNILHDFTNLSPTTEAIKQFADRYGNLGNPTPLYYPNKEEQSDRRIWAGESLYFWTEEIKKMNILTTLWDTLQKREEKELKKYIRWQLNPKMVYFAWKSQRALITSRDHLPELLYHWGWQDYIKPAIQYLHTEISAQLKGHINLRLSPDREIKMYMTPDNLLSALYVLLAMEIKEYSDEPE